MTRTDVFMMSDQIAERTARLVNSQGLHMRPADTFVRVANRFGSNIQLGKGDQLVDGKSILSILTLAAEQGTDLKILAKGPDAKQAVSALAELIEKGFAQDLQEEGGPQLAGEH